MPIYEYQCVDCRTKFERLRPMSLANAPAPCVHCGSVHTSRTLSLFAAVSKGSDGDARAINGTGGGCASCAAGNCATCSH